MEGEDPTFQGGSWNKVCDFYDGTGIKNLCPGRFQGGTLKYKRVISVVTILLFKITLR